MLKTKTGLTVLFFLAFYLTISGQVQKSTLSTNIFTNAYPQQKISEHFEIDAHQDTLVKGYFENDTLAYTYKLYKGHPSGLYKTFHLNGQLQHKAVFINTKLYGDWMTYDEEGTLIVSGFYKMGRKDGEWVFFKEKRIEVYKNGVKHGRWRIYEGWTPWTLFKYKKGVLVDVKRHYPQKSVFK